MLYHFDSIYSNYQSDPFDTTFSIRPGISDIKSINLKSLELPIAINNIRSASNLNSITITTNATSYNVTIPDGNYLTIASIINAVNSAFSAIVPGTTSIVFSVTSNNNISIAFSDSTHTSTNFNISRTLLARYILGFRNPMQTNAGSALVSNLVYNLNVDNYITMFLSGFSLENTSNSANFNSTFKIPLNAINGVIYFLNDQINFQQNVKLLASGQVITSIRVQMFDRFGCPLLNNNPDYSFTLELH